VLFAWYFDQLADFRQTKYVKRPIFLSWIKFVLFKHVNSCLKITVAYYTKDLFRLFHNCF